MSEHTYDIAIIGGGPAGLSAALTGRIRNKDIVIFERSEFSAKLQSTHLVDNYLGMPQITGKGMMQCFSAHALSLNPTLIKDKVVNIFPGDTFTLLTPTQVFTAKAVIIATGVVSTALFNGEKEFLGCGVSYCATCDGMLYKGRDVAVIAYTDDDEHETAYLAELCRTVYFLPQYEGDYADVPATVKIMPGTRLKSIEGDNGVQKIITTQGELPIECVFIMRQSDPVETLLPDLELEGDFIKVNRDMMTNIPGVFAAGDCTGKPLQIAKATGEGLIAVLNAITYISKRNKADNQ